MTLTVKNTVVYRLYDNPLLILIQCIVKKSCCVHYNHILVCQIRKRDSSAAKSFACKKDSGVFSLVFNIDDTSIDRSFVTDKKSSKARNCVRHVSPLFLGPITKVLSSAI